MYCIAIQADISDEKKSLNYLKEFIVKWETITHLVNNVGILKTKMPLMQIAVSLIKLNC